MPVKKKPPTSAKDVKQIKKVKQTKPRQEEEIIEEQPEIEVEKEKPCETWLDHLPPVIKPDEELHKKLSAERKAKKEKIRMDICREELGAIFNYAMTFMKVSKQLSERDLKKKKSAMKTDFLAGNFIINEPEQQPNAVSTPAAEQSVSFISGPQSPPSIQKLLDTSEMTVQEAMCKLMSAVESPNFTYDANPELDQFLQTLARDMKPFTEPAPQPERVPCPFIISVVGPPCSGKSTICNFISKFFDVKFLNVLASTDDSDSPDAIKGGGDEKTTVAKLVKEISGLPPNQGLLIRNFPANKSQLVAFDKALAQFSKQVKKETTVHIVFRTVMTLEEATKQMSQRTIRKSTGTVYHPKFNPPNPVDVASGSDIQAVPEVPNLASVYDKALQGSAACELLTKKGIPVISVPFLDTVDKLHMQIENALRQVYDQHNVRVPFTSFVNYVDVDKLVHAKLCHDIFNIWHDKCVPLYATDIASLYMKMLAVEHRMDYLELYTKEKLSLMLSRPDYRREMSLKFQQSPGDYGSFFKEIWDKSIEIRDNQNHMTAEILHSSGLSLLKGFLDECELIIFASLIKRFFLVDWFIKSFKNITSEHVNDDPVIKEFDPHDIEGLCSTLGLSSYQKFAESKMPKEEPARKRGSKGAVQTITVTMEEKMRNFLEFLWTEMTIKVMRADAKLLLHINDYLTSRKGVIYSEIDSRIEKLQQQLANWVDKKYAREMENFAKRFRRLKQGEKVSEPLFDFDRSFVDSDARIKAVIDRLGNRLPAIEEQLHLPIDKISHLFEKIGELNVDNISLENLLELAKESKFDENELDILEVMVRMTALPDYIDVKTFITSHMPSKQVVDEFQDALNSARREKPSRRP